MELCTAVVFGLWLAVDTFVYVGLPLYAAAGLIARLARR